MRVAYGERRVLPSAKRAAVLALVCGAASCASEPMRAWSQEPPPQSEPVPQEPTEPTPTEPEPTEPTPTEPTPTETPASGQTWSEAAATPVPHQLEGPEGVPGPGWVHGSLAVRYRGRYTDEDRDQDLRGVLALDVADPKTPWIKGYLLARTDIDLGFDEGPILQDLSNTYDGAVVSKLYLAYADLLLGQSPEGSAGTFRIGRQCDPRLPEVLRLDGVSYLTRPMKEERELQVGVYAGQPVHLYESTSNENLAFGTFVEGRPWTSGWARFDWMHLEDELVMGEERDDLLDFEVWQEVSKRWRLEGEFSHLEGDPRDLRLTSLFNDAESESNVRVNYYELLETQKERATELDPFFEQLLAYEPFRQGTVNASQALGEHAQIDGGVDLRRVTHSDDVGEFNRDYERYYLTGTWRDLGTEGLALSATVDFWDGDDQDTNSVGADLSYSVADRWQASIGSYYSLYKYELLELSEQEDVRTYYIRTSRKVSSRLDFDIQYELEDDDFETYHTLRMGLLWKF